jgi:hypothetical protein
VTGLILILILPLPLLLLLFRKQPRRLGRAVRKSIPIRKRLYSTPA